MQGGIFRELRLIENGRKKTHFVDTIGTVIGDIGRDACTVTQPRNGTGNRMIKAIDAIHQHTHRPLDLMLVTHEGIADDGLPQFLMTRPLFDHPPVTIGHDEDHGLTLTSRYHFLQYLCGVT